jgi:hypothetical protein
MTSFKDFFRKKVWQKMLLELIKKDFFRKKVWQKRL